MAGRSRPTVPRLPAMCDARVPVVCSAALLLVLHSVVALVSGEGSTAGSSWSTLSGNAPLVIARGGFSGLFPDSSLFAYNFALASSLPNVVLWCDVQLTKDARGICFPDVKLNNASDISNVFKNRESTYSVNGAPTKGLFSSDFTFKDLSIVSLTQGIYSRSGKFDGNLLQILTVEEVATQFKPTGFWLNIQNDAFYKQQNLSMRSYVLGVSRRVVVNYISSPDIGFLRSIVARINPTTTKLVFRFLVNDEMEPSTNQTYGSLLTNLTFIKTFASGILVPKTYIWLVDPTSMYLQNHTSVVSDAHDAGLEVYASDFVNDVLLSYHYSYDPLAEYLNFVDNGIFSVDGVLSDFPLTPSAAIDCFSHLGGNDSAQVETLVISRNGASGDFPGCTDLAYTRAIHDGVDILDCPVQMSKDRVPFCLGSIDLEETTSVAQSQFNNRSVSIPAIKGGTGIYTFSLTWDEIQSLKTIISNPYSDYELYRDPGNKNKGKFLSLTDFLVLTNTSSLTGVLISIENAAYLAQNQSLDVTDSVLEALSKAGYDKTTTQKVLIQSTNSSVLMKFKEKANYELVYRVDERIGDADSTAIEDIKAFADSVVIGKSSIFTEKQAFLTGSTDIVSKLHESNLSVYAETFSNEFVSQAWDFFSDATVEINSYVIGAKIDGVITDFPKTAARYKRNRCLNMGNNTPAYMSQVEPGSLLSLIPPPDMPPVGAPLPVLRDADVAEAPLPPVSNEVAGPAGMEAKPPTATSGQPRSCASMLVWSLGMMLAALSLKL